MLPGLSKLPLTRGLYLVQKSLGTEGTPSSTEPKRKHTFSEETEQPKRTHDEETESSAEEDADSDSDWIPESSSKSCWDSDFVVPPSNSDSSDVDSVVFPLLKMAGFGAGSSVDKTARKGQCVGIDGEDGDICGERAQDGKVGGEREHAEETGMNVAQRGKGKYKWDKKHSCKYCSKLVLKMSTHMQDVHKDHTEVAKILSMNKGSKERRQAWIKLQDEGDYLHNMSVLEKKSGCVIPKYRTKSSKVENLLACRPTYCKGLYQQKLISVHVKHCHLKPSQSQPIRKGDAAKLGRLMLPVPLDVDSSFYHKVLSRQKDDEISRLIKNDSLLLEYGKRLFDRRDLEEHTAGQISSRMRELGRLLKILRKKSEMAISNLNQSISSAHFDQLVQAVKELAEFDEHTHQFRKGNLAMRIGHALKKCSQIKQSQASKKLGGCSDEMWQQQLCEAQRFDSVFTGDWYDCVSATAAQSVGRRTMNKPKLIPSCEDVSKVQKLLDKKMAQDDYPTVVKAVLCAVSLFNRKRGGELQRMKIPDFQNAKIGKTTNQDILKGLSEVEKKMVSHFHRVEIRGKFNRPVPILLTKAMMDTMERILGMRQAMPALAASPYIFATPFGQRPYRGHDVLKEHALEAQVSNPAIFTFTQLRKQVATLAQAMAITDLDQDQLADFLGHDIRIHRHIYRQPQEVLQKAKVAMILLSVNNGMTDFETCIRDELQDEDINFDEKTLESSSKVSNKTAAKSGKCVISPQKTVTKKRSMAREEATSYDDDSDSSACVPIPKKAKFTRRQWGEAEEKIVQMHFSKCLVLNKLPGKREIEEVIAQEPALRNRRWTNIKDYLRNKLKKLQSQ